MIKIFTSRHIEVLKVFIFSELKRVENVYIKIEVHFCSLHCTLIKYEALNLDGLSF